MGERDGVVLCEECCGAMACWCSRGLLGVKHAGAYIRLLMVLGRRPLVVWRPLLTFIIHAAPLSAGLRGCRSLRQRDHAPPGGEACRLLGGEAQPGRGVPAGGAQPRVTGEKGGGEGLWW